MNYEPVLRLGSYYGRISDKIASDPLAFYTRAEKGRQWQEQFRLRGNAEKLLSKYKASNVVALKPNTTKAAKAAKGICK